MDRTDHKILVHCYSGVNNNGNETKSIQMYRNRKKCVPFHPVGLGFKSVMCVEVTLTRLYQKTKWARHGRVSNMLQDKTDKPDSNQRMSVFYKVYLCRRL